MQEENLLKLIIVAYLSQLINIVYIHSKLTVAVCLTAAGMITGGMRDIIDTFEF